MTASDSSLTRLSWPIKVARIQKFPAVAGIANICASVSLHGDLESTRNEHLTSVQFASVEAPEQQSDVVVGTHFVEGSSELLDTVNKNQLGGLDSAGRNQASLADDEHVPDSQAKLAPEATRRRSDRLPAEPEP
ncbi:hypothetical protein [Mycobacterium sp. DL592]|uniref:hypothetical protein n=1 Tax=Mycobacterium sp. DL592 TaxID=2675524 RepID=UPI001423EEB6|nr:hypothetical protein [Mycobacterium sp. DL592]